MEELLESGFVDSFRHLYPVMTGAYTWWSYMYNARANNAGWRIDYFLTSQDLADRIEDSVIYPEITGSDHCPIGLLLDRKLIEECGRLQVPGRPRLYRTTKQFLRAFHLTSLDDLPELPDLGGEGQMRIGEDGQIMDPADTAEITGADTPETAGAMEEEAP